MYELLRASAQRDPSRTAVVFGATPTTYGELLDAAHAVAAALASRGITRFAVLDPDPAVIIPILAGASLAGAEACVYPLAATDEAVADLKERLDHEVLVSSRPGGVPPDELTSFEGTAPEPSEHRPHLVLTTGTTGLPKGVRHTWDRLVRPSRDVTPTPDHRWLLAYGMNQFGGLQVLLHVLASGSTLVATEAFAPREGLVAMREHGVTHASATPTYWRFLLAQLRSDGGAVPALRQVSLGGEASSQDLLDDLRRTFADANVTQIYAANEFGPAPSVRDSADGFPVSLLEQGGDVDLSVRDGELWVRSRVGMLGYYGEDPVDPEAWRPTGDLVDLVGDRVVVRGRSSDVINVGGVKVHPLPVEQRIAEIAGVAVARVFGRKNALTGAVVAVEVVAEPDADHEKVDAAIREACADLPPAARPRSIRFVDEIATTGLKIVRRTTAEEASRG